MNNVITEKVVIHNPIGNLYRKRHVLVLVVDTDSNFILGKKRGFYPDHIARMLGGGIEENEDPKSAAKREIEEELLVDVPADSFKDLCSVVTQASTSEGDMEMQTWIYSVRLSDSADIKPSDDITGIQIFSQKKYENLVTDMMNLSGEFITEKFSFLWADWEKYTVRCIRMLSNVLSRQKIKNMEQEEKYSKICEDLKRVVEKTKEPLEGNCVYRHLSFDQWDVLLNKRINYQKAVKEKKFICEIGFNAGHSLLAMILANPSAHYILFDLGTHSYARPCFEYLKGVFPQTTMEIFWGDSRDMFTAYRKQYPEIVFDLIHIDGGHRSEVYSVDWKNSIGATSCGSLIIFDDTDSSKVNAFLDEEIEKGVVSESSGFLKTYGYEQRILMKN